MYVSRSMCSESGTIVSFVSTRIRQYRELKLEALQCSDKSFYSLSLVFYSGRKCVNSFVVRVVQSYRVLYFQGCVYKNIYKYSYL